MAVQIVHGKLAGPIGEDLTGKHNFAGSINAEAEVVLARSNADFIGVLELDMEHIGGTGTINYGDAMQVVVSAAVVPNDRLKVNGTTPGLMSKAGTGEGYVMRVLRAAPGPLSGPTRYHVATAMVERGTL